MPVRVAPDCDAAYVTTGAITRHAGPHPRETLCSCSSNRGYLSSVYPSRVRKRRSATSVLSHTRANAISAKTTLAAATPPPRRVHLPCLTTVRYTPPHEPTRRPARGSGRSIRHPSTQPYEVTLSSSIFDGMTEKPEKGLLNSTLFTTPFS